MTPRTLALLVLALAACSESRVSDHADAPDAAPGAPADGGPQVGCGDLDACFTVYVHTDHELYVVDLTTRALVDIGRFDAPIDPTLGGEDVITDLAVAPDGALFAISASSFYAVEPATGKATPVGPLAACGAFGVALTFASDGQLYAGDYNGAFCRIDPTTSPPTVTPLGSLGGGLALAGDLVATSDGTIYGTAYDLGDVASESNNQLVTIDPATGHATPIAGATGFGRLFGVAYALGEVFAFSHDGSGDALTIDPATGAGTRYATFVDPATGFPLIFAGAAVSSRVPPDVVE
jgi:hypothetical protein